MLGVPSIPLASFAGSLVGTGIVYLLATRVSGGLSTNVLLLAGVTLNAFFSALITFVQYLVDFADWYRTARWMMGDLDVSSLRPDRRGPAVHRASRSSSFAMLPRTLNLLTSATTSRPARGVDIGGRSASRFSARRWPPAPRSRWPARSASSASSCPHLVRLMVGSDHRIVLPASALFGAAFLVICDLVARTMMSPIEMPVGIVTAMIGGPFFLWLLVRKS